MPPSGRGSRRLLLGMAVAFGAALLVHPVLGWTWTPLAGAVGGWVAVHRSWIAGGIGTCAAWACFTAWSFSVDSRAVGEMMRVVATILGDLPAAATVVITLLAGTLLGAAGGLLGGGVRNIVRPVSR